jgi:hypothetical protein
MGAQRVVDRDAAAEQRRGVFAFQRFGNGNHKAGIGADAVGIAAVAVHAGAFRGGQRFSMPRVHHSHSPQEFDCQPRPTRWPT